MRNLPFQETPAAAAALETIRRALPPSWTLRSRPPTLRTDRRIDGFVDLAGPNHTRLTFAVKTMRAGSVAAGTVVDAASGLAARSSQPLLFLLDYINPTLRSGLAEAGISFVDGTGWMRLVCEDPLLVLSSQGASRAPRSRENASIARLNGRAAGRIIRAMLERPVPLGVRELAQLTATSPGSVAKLLPTLVAEGAIDRDASGAVSQVRRRTLLDRWTTDYSFESSNSIVLDYLAPRGLASIVQELRHREDMCVTGSAAARTYLPKGMTSVVPMTHLAGFARDVQALASDLKLVRTDRRSANVLLTQPADMGLLENPRLSSDGLPTAPVSQVLGDLLTMPGRAAQEAEQLIDILGTTDPAWRA